MTGSKDTDVPLTGPIDDSKVCFPDTPMEKSGNSFLEIFFVFVFPLQPCQQGLFPDELHTGHSLPIQPTGPPGTRASEEQALTLLHFLLEQNPFDLTTGHRKYRREKIRSVIIGLPWKCENKQTWVSEEASTER